MTNHAAALCTALEQWPRAMAVSTPQRPAVDETTRAAIFRAYEMREQRTTPREHLGASTIGKDCERELWYELRWFSPSTYPGRMLRLLETGLREEDRILDNLQQSGFFVYGRDPGTGQQWRVRTHGGHFGGSLDGLVCGLPDDPERWHVLECKTHAAASFRALVGKGLRQAKPLHLAQIQAYLALTGLEAALYIAVNKDNDDLYLERICRDQAMGQALLEKAWRIIFSSAAPERISTDPNWHACKLCAHRSVCHEGKAPARHCRTCTAAQPVEGGWQCGLKQQKLPLHAQREGCAQHAPFPADTHVLRFAPQAASTPALAASAGHPDARPSAP